MEHGDERHFSDTRASVFQPASCDLCVPNGISMNRWASKLRRNQIGFEICKNWITFRLRNPVPLVRLLPLGSIGDGSSALEQTCAKSLFWDSEIDWEVGIHPNVFQIQWILHSCP